MAAVAGVVARRMGLDWRKQQPWATQSEKKKEKKSSKRQKKQKFTISGGFELELYEKYAPRNRLGDGKYGVVFSSINLETNETVAIKKITDPFRSAATARRTLREAQILRRIGPHDNIVQLKDVMLSENDDVYLVHELMDYNLAQIIAYAKPNLLPAGLVKYVLFQILRGLKFLHSANVIHRDLKPENILVNDDWKLKICDFGLARTARPGPHMMTANIGTPAYMAPELVNKSEACYDNHVDMWSAGCILAELLGGVPRDVLLYPSADPLAVNLLKRMLVVDPSHRISASEALRHPYFSGLYNPLLDGSAPAAVRLQVDHKPGGLDAKKIRDLLWVEMLYHHPEELNFSSFITHLFHR